jgi:hypothetical protein
MLSRHPRYWWHCIPVCHRLWYVTSYVVLCYYVNMHQRMFWTHVCFMWLWYARYVNIIASVTKHLSLGMGWLARCVASQPVSPRMTVCRLLTSSMSVMVVSTFPSLMSIVGYVNAPSCGSFCVLDIPVGDYAPIRELWSVCGSLRLISSCEVHVAALWAALWMSQWSGSAMLGVYLWMSQYLYYIVKYE